MSVWWCNQTHSWKREHPAGVVCSETTDPRSRYRWMVSEARKGDRIVHYRSGIGVVAVSRAAGNAVRCREGDRRTKICLYGEGWSFRTEYHLLEPPIPRERFVERLALLPIEEGPVVRDHGGNPRVRQAYFMRFSEEGWRVIAGALQGQSWPSWTKLRDLARTLSSTPPSHTGALLAAVEGVASETKRLLRGRNRALRNRALEAASGTCAACGIDFTNVLGGDGLRALHVHHRKQLASFHLPRVTTLEDLAVLCATCHALVHADPKRAMAVETLRTRLLQEGYLAQ